MSRFQVFLAALTSIGLVLTKFALLPVTMVLAMSFLVTQWRAGQRRNVWLFLTVGVALALVQIVYQIGWLNFNPLQVLNPQLETKSTQTLVAFSAAHILPNTWFYLKTLVGSSTRFLWQSWPLTSPLVLLAACMGAVQSFFQGRNRSWLLSVGAVFLAQFGLALPFYVADSRYIVITVPLLCILTAYGLDVLTERKWKVTVFSVLLIVVSLLFSQAKFYREIIAANLLHRSQAWQYESILHFDQYLAQRLPQSKKIVLITVLPPFLVDLYSTGSYTVLPLSLKQEFMNANQRPWGELDYQHLDDEYRRHLQNGGDLFATNAYLSSQHEFEADWLFLNQQFKVEPVTEGCFSTCQLYRVTLP